MPIIGIIKVASGRETHYFRGWQCLKCGAWVNTDVTAEAHECQPHTWACYGDRAECIRTGYCQRIVHGGKHCADGKGHHDRE